MSPQVGEVVDTEHLPSQKSNPRKPIGFILSEDDDDKK